MGADLHLHTEASDGTFSPKDVVDRAYQGGLKAISITDHDTIAGLPEAMKRGEELGIPVIPGIELSTLWEGEEIHILGYFLDYKDIELQAILYQFVQSRIERAYQMVEKLKEEGILIDMEQVKEIAHSPYIGRPHIARALLELGYIQETSQAFSKEFIGRGARAYVERHKLTPKEAIHLIKKYGGMAILAHPGLCQGRIKKKEIEIFQKEGLHGLEVFYSGHNLQERDYYHQLALEKNLLITGGSDFHDNSLHTPKPGPYLPAKYLKPLFQKADELGKDREEPG